jgi:hypothetical protein
MSPGWKTALLPHLISLGISICFAGSASAQWGGWEPLGGGPVGGLLTQPACVAGGISTIDCFARGADGALWHWNPTNGWVSRLGGILEQPSCVLSSLDRIDCFARGTDQGMWHWNSYDDIRPGDSWVSKGGGLASTVDTVGGLLNQPSCILMGRSIHCFVRGGDQRLWHKRLDAIDSNWRRLSPQIIIEQPSCVLSRPDQIECFVIFPNRAMYRLHGDGRNWVLWESLRGPSGGLSTPPSCLAPDPGDTACFANDASGHMWRWRSNVWIRFDGSFLEQPSCVSWGPGRIDCFARGTNQAMYHGWRPTALVDLRGSEGWRTWEGLGGEIGSAVGGLQNQPSCVSSSLGRIDCFARGSDQQMWHSWWPCPSCEGGTLQTVAVTVHRIRALDTRAENEPDFFVKVKIGDQRYNTEDNRGQDTLEDKVEIAPKDWSFVHTFDRTVTSTVPIVIELFVEDGGFRGPEDPMDISGSANHRGIKLTLNLASCTFTLDSGFGFLDSPSGIPPGMELGTSANPAGCGQRMSTTGDGRTGRDGTNRVPKATLEFTVDAPIGPRTGAVLGAPAWSVGPIADPRIRCLHSPLIPNRGEPITVTAQAVDGAGTVIRLASLAIWYVELNNLSSTPGVPAMASTAPAATCSTVPCQLNVTPAPGAVAFSYGCSAMTTTSTAPVFSGWKTTPVEIPDGRGAIPVVRTALKQNAIDIVFIPDDTSYETVDRNFHNDVLNVINNGYYKEDIFLQFQDKLNFWISRRRGHALDVEVSGCGGTPPSDWADHYAFADVGVVLHTWGAVPGSPRNRDCTPGDGAISSGTAFDLGRVMHETAHKVFGLADEYLPDGSYFEWPGRNVLTSYYSQCDGAEPETDSRPCVSVCTTRAGETDIRTCVRQGDSGREKCIRDLPNLGRVDPRLCRNITGDWWTSDPPENDLMNDNGRAQAADIRRMKEVFARCDSGLC